MAATGSAAFLQEHCSEDALSFAFGGCIGQIVPAAWGQEHSLLAAATVPIEHSLVGTETSRHTCNASQTTATRATWPRIHAISRR
jgi:hypothetical protein